MPTSKRPKSNYHSNWTNTQTPTSPTLKTAHPESTNTTSEILAPTLKSSTKTTNEKTGSNKTRIYLTTTPSSRGRLSTGTTEQPPPKAPESKSSESRGEGWAFLALLRSLYFTYLLIKGTQLKNLSTNVTVTLVNRVAVFVLMISDASLTYEKIQYFILKHFLVVSGVRWGLLHRKCHQTVAVHYTIVTQKRKCANAVKMY